MRRPFVAALLLATIVAAPRAQPSALVIPRPVSLAQGTGTFTVRPTTTVWADRADSAIARRFARSLSPAMGFELPVRVGPGDARSRIVFRRDTTLRGTLGDEGYRLDVRSDRVTITAAAPPGAFYATQTIRQLLPPEVFREAPMSGLAWTMPAVRIEDYPRFRWRGAHLDVSRHFMPKEFVKKYIDLLALHKMNSFHWHLTDDQGWRLEIKKYPRLTEVGAWRHETLVGRANSRDTTHYVFDKKPHGGFYTQDDVREIVAYARERFINVVPEIEMPGHSQATIAAYPTLGNFGDTLPVWTAWGVSHNILNPSDTTVAFMQDVLTEVMALFPGPFVHVGGDEAEKEQWRRSPRAQSRIRELGLKDENELQSWFIAQMDAFLTKHGRRLIGWDEILEGGLAPNAVVMSWRGTAGGITAARAGHDVVMTPGAYTYFDHYQSADRDHEPLAIGGFLPIDSVYLYEPIPTELNADEARHVLGAQAQVWTEYIEGPKNVEYMAYPRMCALAETLWTPRERKDLADFMTRLPAELARLNALDVNFRGSSKP